MITGTLPGSIRDQALGVISRRLGGEPNLQDALAGLGDMVVVNLLLDLEAAFGIGIDPDEVLPDGTLGMLLAIVRLRSGGLLPPLPAPCLVFDFAEARARRARGETELDVPLAIRGPCLLVQPAQVPPLSGEVSAQPTEGASTQTAAEAPSGLRPPPPRGEEPRELAVPSDAAWDRAMAAQTRERQARQLMLVMGAGAAAGAFGALVYWLSALAQLGVA
jgi:hypothetical protein